MLHEEHEHDGGKVGQQKADNVGLALVEDVEDVVEGERMDLLRGPSGD